MDGHAVDGRVRVASDGNELRLGLAGRWMLGGSSPDAADVFERARRAGSETRVAVAADGDLGWDSSLLVFLRGVLIEARRRRMAVDFSGLPDGARRLLALLDATPEREDVGRRVDRPGLLGRIGTRVVVVAGSAADVLAFIGDACVAVARVLTGAARVRRSDMRLLVQDVGVRALPIVSLIAGLVGVILAYVAAGQLRAFGAQVYVADLAGIATTREMGAMMTAVVMAGRTGAAFAAELGAMQVNEEIDALTTFGIPPMEFLVAPRMLALAFMMPLLCVYADLLGMLGGAAVGVGLLHVGAVEYYAHTVQAIRFDDVCAGLIKASVFGVLVAIAGCFRGLRAGRTSAAVGLAATAAVVTSIVLIIVADAIMTFLFDLVHL